MALTEAIDSVSTLNSVGSSFNAVRSLVVPKYFKENEVQIVSDSLRSKGPVALEPYSPKETAQSVFEVLQESADPGRDVAISGSHLITLSGMLVQYTDLYQLPEIRSSYKTSFDRAESLRENLSPGRKTIPEQLSVALDLNEGRAGDALWDLFVSSRLYARWADEAMFTVFPKSLDEATRATLMLDWSNRIYALKERSQREHPDQDPAGDLYYAWTYGMYTYGSRQCNNRIVTKALDPFFSPIKPTASGCGLISGSTVPIPNYLTTLVV